MNSKSESPKNTSRPHEDRQKQRTHHYEPRPPPYQQDVLDGPNDDTRIGTKSSEPWYRSTAAPEHRTPVVSHHHLPYPHGTMTVALDIPDSLAASLGSQTAEVQRVIAEFCASESYRSGRFSLAEVREFLGLGSRWEAEKFLAGHGAWPDPTEDEVLSDLAKLRSISGVQQAKLKNQSGQFVQTIPDSD